MKPYTERLPLIDALIEQWLGEWKYENEDSIKCVSGLNMLSPLEYFDLTRDEFTQRAKELGYINGYKYGVEYETNGEKPDLPDDVQVEYKNLLHGDRWVRISTVGKLYFGTNCTNTTYPITSFRIVDERYKPKEKGINYLPPIGSRVDIIEDEGLMYGHGETDCEVVGHFEDSAIVRMSYGLGCFRAHVLKTASTETDKLQQDILDHWNEKGVDCPISEWDLASHLHALGYRKIKPMSEKDFVSKFYQLKSDGDETPNMGRFMYRAGCRFLDQGE